MTIRLSIRNPLKSDRDKNGFLRIFLDLKRKYSDLELENLESSFDNNVFVNRQNIYEVLGEYFIQESQEKAIKILSEKFPEISFSDQYPIQGIVRLIMEGNFTYK